MAYTIDELIGLALANAIAPIRSAVPRVLSLVAQTESGETGTNLYVWVITSERLPESEERRVEKLVLEALSAGQFNFVGVTPYLFFQTKEERERAGYATS
ncbi:MAG: hypothetical protein JKY65_04985 [Planctomycetes bacterium]|nr:hypothetical protein [Planctomycetota bacterium]